MYDVHGDKTKDLGIKFSMNLEKDEKKFQLRVCNKAASVQSAVTKVIFIAMAPAEEILTPVLGFLGCQREV